MIPVPLFVFVVAFALGVIGMARIIWDDPGGHFLPLWGMFLLILGGSSAAQMFLTVGRC